MSKIYIDGDACPVKRIAVDMAKKNNVEVIIVSSIYHTSHKELAKTVYVDHGYQSVDMAILNLVEKNDIVITDDYGLASLLLMKYTYCLSSKGMVYTNHNIDTLVYSRHLNATIMKGGGRIRGPAKRTKEDDEKFTASLQRLIDYSLRSPQI